MKLKSKLTIWSCGTLFLMIIITAVSWYSIQKLQNTTEYILHTSKMMRYHLELEKYITLMESSEENYIIHNDKYFLDGYYQAKKNAKNNLNIMLQVVRTPSQKVLLSDISKKLNKWTDEIGDTEIVLHNKNRTLNKSSIQSIKNRLTISDTILAKIKNDLLDFSTNEQILMQKRKTSETKTVSYLLYLIVFASVVTMVLFAIMSYLLSLRIRRPLNKAGNMMKNIAEGSADLTSRIKIESNDEIGVLIKWFNIFIEKLQHMIINIQSESDRLSEYSNVLSETAAFLANESVVTSSAINHMTTAMEDLNQVTEANFKNSTTNLANNEESISDFINSIKINDSIEKTEAINEEVKDINDNLLAINVQINDIEKLINETKGLSVQSNILSINASIQANKAGEYGKIFAVIASEIKNMSTSSSITTQNIELIFDEIINVSQKTTLKIDKINSLREKLINDISLHNEGILKKTQVLTNISKSINELSSTRQTQLEGISILSGAMKEINDTSVSNADGAKNLEKASSHLLTLSKKLKNECYNFRT
jgi:methyl-accepting chemotaxis protein